MLSRYALIKNYNVMEIRLHVICDNVELIEVYWVTWHNNFLDLNNIVMIT